MRIGVRLDTCGAYGALLDRDRVLCARSVSRAGEVDPRATRPPGSPAVEPSAAFADSRAAHGDGVPPALHGGQYALLRDLVTEGAAQVTSVTWDISGLLRAALSSPEGRPGSAQRVAALRLLPRLPTAPPMGDHPSAVVRSLISWRDVIIGGHDLFGTELAPLTPRALHEGARRLLATGATTIAVTATGAVARSDHEIAVATELLRQNPKLKLCLSHEAGGPGLLEREAATVINAALLEPADALITACEEATEALPGRPSCWFVTGDGGRVTGRRMRWTPNVGLTSGLAAALIGAARIAQVRDAVVTLTDASILNIGQVRDGLPHVESDLADPDGIRTCVPQAVLSRLPVHGPTAAAQLATRSRHTSDVVAALGPQGAEVAQALGGAGPNGPRLVRTEADLTAVGAALTEPSAWVDLLVPTNTSEGLDRSQAEAEQRALDLVAAYGAGPGSAYIIRSTATAVGYLRIYRLQVRAGSHSTAGAAQ